MVVVPDFGFATEVNLFVQDITDHGETRSNALITV